MKILVLLLSFTTGSFLFANESQKIIAIQNETDLLLSGKQTYYLEDPAGKLTIDEILKPENQEKFQLNTKDVFIRKPSESSYWLKLSIQNLSRKGAWIELGSIYLWYIDYYIKENGKYSLSVETGSLRPRMNKTYPANLFWLPLKTDSDIQTVYIKIKTERPIEIPIQTGSTLSFTQNNKKFDFIFASFIGLMLSMFFYNLFLFFSTKDSIYIWYLLYVIFVIPGVSAINNHLLFDYFLGENLSKWFHVHFLGWSLSSYIFAGFFAIDFLNLQKKTALNITAYCFIFTFGLISLADVFQFLPHSKLVMLTQPFIGIFLLFLLGTGIFLWIIKREKNAWFYSIAWVFAITSTLSYFLTINGILPFNYATRNATFFGIAMEVLMFSFALGNRINLIRNEKREIEEKYVAFAMEQNQILEKKVQERISEVNLIKEQYRTLYDNTPAMNFTIDRDGVIVSVNSFGAETLGYTTDELIGENVMKVIYEPDRNYALEKVSHCFSTLEQIQNWELRKIKKDGKIIWVKESAWSLNALQGKNLLTIICTDISEQKKMEEEVIRTENKYLTLFNSTSYAIMMLNEKGFFDCNQATLDLFGCKTKEEFCSYHPSELSPPYQPNGEDSKTSAQKKIKIAFEDGHHEFEWMHKKANSEQTFPADVYLSSFKLDGKPVLQALVTDSSIRKQVEEKIIQLSQAVEQSPVSIVITDTNGAIQYVNHKFVTLTGYSFEEALGKNPRILKSGTASSEVYRGLWKKISNGEEWNGEFQNKKKNGKLYYEHAKISPIVNSIGEITHYLAIKEDITERKEIEERLKLQYEVSDILSIASTLNEAIPGLLNSLLHFSNWRASTLWKIDSSGEELHCEGMSHLPGFEIENFEKETRSRKFKKGVGLPGRVWEEKKPVWITDIMNDSNFPRIKAAFQDNLVSAIAFPIMFGDEVLGVIECFHSEEILPNDKLIKAFHNLSQQIGQFFIHQDAKNKLIIAIDEAKSANRAKSEFLATMSHEIRTPLNGVIGFSDLLIKTPLDETQSNYLKIVNQSAAALLDLLNDILDFSKIEAGKLELNMEKADIYELASQSSDIIKYKAHEKNLKVILNISPNVPHSIYIDPVRLRQILVNLLGNAVKFTKQGEIELRISCDDNDSISDKVRMLFSVRDTGIGISKENYKKIFEAFSQEDSSTSRKYGGTGLGLSISNRLLFLMNSRLELESELGKGSRFFFYLPVKIVPIGQSDLPERNLSGHEDNTIVKNSKFLTNVSILIVDDDEVNMLLAQTILTQLLPNGRIIEASNGKDAIRQFKNERPDIIFMDVQMSEMNGYETTFEIRKSETDSKVPIIALTAGVTKEEIENCFQSGMDDYASKPITKSIFEKLLNKWLPKKAES